MKKIAAIVSLILGLIALSGVFVSYGAEKKDVEKDIQFLQKVDEKLVEDTEEVKEFLIEQRVYNQSVAGSLEGINKILDKMNP